MRPVSDAFLRTLRGSHRAVFEARVVPAGQTGTDPDGETIPILGGDVRIDGTAAVRSTVDLTTDGSLWPTSADSLLAPYGRELWIRRGIGYGDGTVEWVSLGYHTIWTPDQDDAPDGPIQLVAYDRMAGLRDARLLAPVQYPAGTMLGAIVTELVTEVYPWATIEWDDATDTSTLGRALIVEEDRHGALADLVTAAAKVWHWDHRGHLVIASPPDPGSPVWDVDHGAHGVLVRMSRQVTREGVYNAVVATGEGADTTAPARGVAVDNSPSSPTYWYGDFGKVPKFFNSPILTSDAAAQAAAETILRRSLGLPYSVDLACVPNPALEPDDPVRITYAYGRAPETHIISSLTIPLTVEAPVTAATREQTTILIGSV